MSAIVRFITMGLAAGVVMAAALAVTARPGSAEGDGQSLAVNPIIRYVPDGLTDTVWLNTQRNAQIKALASVPTFHDFQFVNRLSDTGINFKHRIVDDARKTYQAAHYDHGNGLAVTDVDGDGLLDIYFVNQVGGSQLWRNLGGGKFENITGSAGVAVAGKIGVSASFADIDNDGDADLYVTTVRGGNVLFENGITPPLRRA